MNMKSGMASRILHGMRVLLKHDRKDKETVEIINGRIIRKESREENNGDITANLSNEKCEEEGRNADHKQDAQHPRPDIHSNPEIFVRKSRQEGVLRETPPKVPVGSVAPTTERQETGKDSIAPDKERPKEQPIDIDSFITSLKASGRSKQTITSYKSDIRFWKKAAARKNKIVAALTFKEIEEIIANHDKNTARRRLSCLRQLGKWQLRNGHAKLHLETQKCYAVKRKARVPRAKAIKEYRRIRKQAQELCLKYDRRGIWLGLMISCGLRISEIQTTEITGNSIKVLGKGDKERVIPCPGWLIKAMENIPKRARGGYQRCRQNIDRELRKMQYSKMHSLRHTYATVLIRNGVNIEDIQKLLGHNELSTTQVYAQNKIPNNICETLANA